MVFMNAAVRNHEQYICSAADKQVAAVSQLQANVIASLLLKAKQSFYGDPDSFVVAPSASLLAMTIKLRHYPRSAILAILEG